MADVQRTGGVGTDELDLDLAAGAGLAATEAPVLAEHFVKFPEPGQRREGEVDEPRAGDLQLAPQPAAVAKGGDQHLGDLARGLALGAGQQHRQVGGKVAVLGVAGHFQLDVGGRCRNEGTGGKAVLERIGKALPQRFPHGCASPSGIGAGSAGRWRRVTSSL